MPTLAWLILCGAAIGPWIVGGWLWYLMTIFRAFGVPLALP